MSNTNKDGKTTIPMYNFENVRGVMKTLRNGVEKANKTGCYSLDESCVLKQSLDLVNNLVDVVEQYQTAVAKQAQTTSNNVTIDES